jgi:hypothetical protein
MIDSSLSMSKETENFKERGNGCTSSQDHSTSFPICFLLYLIDSPKNVSEVVRKLRSNIPQSRCKLESFVNLEKQGDECTQNCAFVSQEHSCNW